MLKAFKNLQSIPTSEDDAGMVVSFNRSNADGETNIRNMFVNAFGPSKAFVLSQVTTEGTAEVDLLTLYRNGQIKSGGTGWLEPLAGQTESIAGLAVLSKSGMGMPIVGAVRTSDLTAPAYMAGQGIFGFGYNNRARTGSFDTTFMGWGGYFECRRDPGAGRAHGIEVGTVNLDNGTDAMSLPTPYSYAQDNQISSMWHSAGRPDVGSGQRDIDVAAGFIQNGPVGHQVSYGVGVLFGEKSVREVGGVAPVMRMPTHYQIEWYTSGGLKAYFRSEQTSGGTLIGQVIRDSAVDFEFGASAKMRLTTAGLRSLDYNGGFDANGLYVGASSANPTQQWQIQSGSGALFLNKNTNTHASPSYANRGNWNDTTGAYSSVSDERLKNKTGRFDRDIMETIEALAEASWLYTMKDDAAERPQFGFMAQGVQAVLPEAVSGDETLYVTDRPIIAALTLAVADLNARLKTVENQ